MIKTEHASLEPNSLIFGVLLFCIQKFKEVRFFFNLASLCLFKEALFKKALFKEVRVHKEHRRQNRQQPICSCHCRCSMLLLVVEEDDVDASLQV